MVDQCIGCIGRHIALFVSRRQRGLMSDNFQDGGRQLHCVSEEVLRLKSMKNINKHWKLLKRYARKKNLSLMGARCVEKSFFRNDGLASLRKASSC